MKKVVLIFILNFLIFIPVESKKVFFNKNDKRSHSQYHNKTFYTIDTLENILKKNPKIRIQQCFQDLYFNVEPFPLSDKFPYQGYFKQPYILFIPEGKITRASGIVISNNIIIKDVIRLEEEAKNIENSPFNKTLRLNGKIASITQGGVYTYFHWINEVLGRLAFLEIYNIEYDKLFVPTSSFFMKESLDLWGIDESKIIFSNSYIQADELIIPSIIMNQIDSKQAYASHYAYPILSKYVRDKLLLAAQKKVDFDTYDFSKKIFISRADAYNARRILNEEEVFKLFEAKGFKRYELSKMSLLEQIILFHQADIVVSEHGSGLTNILFCKPKTKIIEIFQTLVPVDYWWISKIFDLDYAAIKAVPTDVDYFADVKEKEYLSKAWHQQINIPLDEVKKFIETMI